METCRRWNSSEASQGKAQRSSGVQPQELHRHLVSLLRRRLHTLRPPFVLQLGGILRLLQLRAEAADLRVLPALSLFWLISADHLSTLMEDYV